MRGGLNVILREPISPENEAVLLELLRREMTVCRELAVDLLREMERRFGAEAREVMREMAGTQELETSEQVGEPEADLRSFCAMVDRVAAGSHRWGRVIDEPADVALVIGATVYTHVLGRGASGGRSPLDGL